MNVGLLGASVVGLLSDGFLAYPLLAVNPDVLSVGLVQRGMLNAGSSIVPPGDLVEYCCTGMTSAPHAFTVLQ